MNLYESKLNQLADEIWKDFSDLKLDFERPRIITTADGGNDAVKEMRSKYNVELPNITQKTVSFGEGRNVYGVKHLTNGFDIVTGPIIMTYGIPENIQKTLLMARLSEYVYQNLDPCFHYTMKRENDNSKIRKDDTSLTKKQKSNAKAIGVYTKAFPMAIDEIAVIHFNPNQAKDIFIQEGKFLIDRSSVLDNDRKVSAEKRSFAIRSAFLLPRVFALDMYKKGIRLDALKNPIQTLNPDGFSNLNNSFTNNLFNMVKERKSTEFTHGWLDAPRYLNRAYDENKRKFKFNILR